MAGSPLPLIAAAAAVFFLMKKGNGEKGSVDDLGPKLSDYEVGTLETSDRTTDLHKYSWSVGKLVDGSGWKWSASQYGPDGERIADAESGVMGSKTLAGLAAQRMVAEWMFLEITEPRPDKPDWEYPSYVSGSVEMFDRAHGEYGYVWTVGQIETEAGEDEKWRFVIDQFKGMETLQHQDSLILPLGQPSTKAAAVTGVENLVEMWIGDEPPSGGS